MPAASSKGCNYFRGGTEGVPNILSVFRTGVPNILGYQGLRKVLRSGTANRVCASTGHSYQQIMSGDSLLCLHMGYQKFANCTEKQCGIMLNSTYIKLPKIFLLCSELAQKSSAHCSRFSLSQSFL